MTATNDQPSTPGSAVSEMLLDLLVYAPIGLALDAEILAPDLARRGRRHSAAARQIGELVVKQGVKRLDQVIAQMSEPATTNDGPDPTTEATSPVSAQGESGLAPASSSRHLAIPDYDLLAASQVVKRLDSLADQELEEVRIYESGTRDRRTILHKIARLQD